VPRMNTCHHCRAFFPLDETRCPHCGTSIIPRKIRAEGGIFDRLLPPGKGLCISIIAANALLYVGMLVYQGGPAGGMLAISVRTVADFGGLWVPAIRYDGEWYRLLCPIFLHFSVIHIGFNCMVIWVLGRVAETVYGPAKLLTLYLLCGIVASLTSYLWNYGVNLTSAGASGAAFGLFGLVGVFAWKRGLDDIKRSVVQWTLINLVFGFTVGGIDMAAHLGGLAAGIALGLAVKDARMTRLRPVAVRMWDVGAVLSVVAVLAAFGIAFVGGGVIGGR